MEGDPISACKGFWCERWVELENPSKRPPKISDRRVGPPLVGRLDLAASERGRWRRRPIPTPGISLCLVYAMHRELWRILPSAGKDDRWDGGRQRARCTQHLCSASLCVCLHHRLVTCSFQPATACDRSGAHTPRPPFNAESTANRAAYAPMHGDRDARTAGGRLSNRRITVR